MDNIMEFKKALQALRRANRQSKLSSLDRYEERFGMLDKVVVLPSAANTEKHIVEFLKLSGFHAAKTEVKPTILKGKDYKTGAYTIKGKDTHITSGARKGQADISATMYGISVHIELKYSPTDRQSKYQREFENDVNKAGGIYIIVHNVDHFYKKYLELLEHPKLILMRSYEELNPK